MKQIVFLLVFFLYSFSWAELRNAYEGRENPTQIAQLICMEEMERHHNDRYIEVFNNYSNHNTPENEQAFRDYTHTLEEFRSEREEYLGDLNSLMGRRYGLFDNRFNRDVQAGVLTRNIAQDGFRKAIRDRSMAGVLTTPARWVGREVLGSEPSGRWERDQDGYSVYLADIIASEPFINELASCQRRFDTQIPDLFYNVARTAGVHDRLGDRVARIGSAVLGFIGGGRILAAAGRSVPSVAARVPGIGRPLQSGALWTGRQLQRVPNWARHTAVASAAIATVFPEIRREVREQLRNLMFLRSGDANDLGNFRHPDLWRDFYDDTVNLYRMSQRYNDAGNNEEKIQILHNMMCLARAEMVYENPGSRPPILSARQRLESILHFFNEGEGLSDVEQAVYEHLIWTENALNAIEETIPTDAINDCERSESDNGGGSVTY